MEDYNKRTSKIEESWLIMFVAFIVILSVFVFQHVYAQPSSGEGIGIVVWQTQILPLILGGGILSAFYRFTNKKYLVWKRIFDIMLSIVGLLISFPLFIIIAVLIKLDSVGPVFFSQKRLGEGGKIFYIYKFRTMRYRAELETGPVWAKEADPRVTRIGRFLRKSHLDELPQLWNVLKGDMSIIGPRPERPEMNHMINQYIPNFNQRLKIKPGITGLAQVRYNYGATIKDAARKLKYDIIYINKMCLLLDLRIVFWTIGRVLTGEGAR